MCAAICRYHPRCCVSLPLSQGTLTVCVCVCVYVCVCVLPSVDATIVWGKSGGKDARRNVCVAVDHEKRDDSALQCVAGDSVLQCVAVAWVKSGGKE